MNPTFNHFTKGQHVPGGYQQQSGQTILNIGAFGPYPITMSHTPANIFVNQPHLQRTFASVVSCENPRFGVTHHFVEEPQNSDQSGILNSFIKRLSKPQQPMPNQPHLYQQQYTQKEFEDFTKIPTVIQNQNPQPANYANPSYSTPLSYPNCNNNNNFETMKMPFMNQSAYYQSSPPPPTQSQPTKQHHQTPRPPRNNFFNALWGNFYATQPQQNQQHHNQQNMYQKPNNGCPHNNNNNKRWYQRGFPRFYRNNNHKQQNPQQHRHHSRFHHHDASNPKHMHEKERHSIERDIKNDYCDINSEKSTFEDEKRCEINNTETANNPSSSSNSNSECDNSKMNPPFEIFSLEEFPAIVNSSKDADHDFVTYKDDAAATTPSYTPSWPRRISLCEKVSKIVKSPQKLLPLTLATPRRSCLKPTQRNRSMSECSDDFIVFEYSCDDGAKDEDSDSEEEVSSDDDDNESDMSDDDTIMGEESSEDMDETDAAMRREDEKMQCDHQPDSGIDGEFEPKKVQFNLNPTVHVMHAWSHAYRASRDGSQWRQGAIDRERFKKRCLEVEEVLKPIFQKSHRDRIFSERFKENLSTN